MKDKIKSLIDQYNKTNALKSWHELEDPSLKEIINMGDEAIPHLLQFVGTSWVPIIALHFITKEELIEEKDFGKYKVINEAWINWGKQKGYL